MPDMNFSTWNHACSKVNEILELEENIQIVLFNISQSSVKSMLQMLSYAATLKFPYAYANVVYITYVMSLDKLASRGHLNSIIYT